MMFIYSHGGHARDCARFIRLQYPTETVFFVDDDPKGAAISYEKAREMALNQTASFIVAFANPALRKRKTDQVVADGFLIRSSFAPSAIIGDNVAIAEGALLSEFTIITADATIGKSFHANIYSYITHDCVIGDYVTLAPRVSINGRVHIADNVYIGTGATILPGKPDTPIMIREGAIIGAHALITKDVPAHATMVGAPAKQIRGK